MRAAPVLASLFGILFAANASDARLTPIDWMQWQGSVDPAIDPLNWDKANATFREIVWHAQNDTIKQDAYASKKLLWANGHVSVRAIIRCEAVQNYQTGETLTDCFVAPNGDPYPSKNAANSNIPWVSYWAYVKANVMPQLKSTNPSMPDWPLEEAPPLPGEPIVRQVQQDPNKYNTRYIDFAWTFTLQPGPARRPPPRRQPGISSNSGSNQAQCDELQREITFSRSRPGGQQNVVAASEEMRRLGCPGYGTQQPDIANNPVPSKADCLALQNAYNSSEIAPALSGRGKDLQQMSRTTGTQLQECWQKYWASGGAGPGGGPPPGLSCGHGLNC